MKRICFFIISFLAAIPAMTAQSNRSAVRIAFSDGSPVVVTLDDRRYKKHGASLTIGDLPPGKHYLKVYAFTPFKKGGGGNAELIFQGKVKVKANTFYNGVVDISSGTLTMNPEPMPAQDNNGQQGSAPPPNSFNNDGGSPENANNAPVAENNQPVPQYDFTSDDMNDLHGRVEKLETDSDKLKLMKSVLSKHTYITDEVKQMLAWFSFDDSRLDFVKWAYKGTVDQQNYSKLGAEFSFTDTKNDFDNFMKGK